MLVLSNNTLQNNTYYKLGSYCIVIHTTYSFIVCYSCQNVCFVISTVSSYSFIYFKKSNIILCFTVYSS